MSADPAVARLHALAAVLERVADATAGANPDALASCEASLEATLTHVPSAVDLAGADADAVRSALRRIHEALFRCRALGRATTDLVTLSLAAQGMAPGYRPAGIGASAPRHGRLEVRV
ncbi:MAG: hypothetical protein JSU08_11530 [Acidobacteria bacterium]|nr:hypothetical protein [Acidobacteriota bacterium]